LWAKWGEREADHFGPRSKVHRAVGKASYLGTDKALLLPSNFSSFGTKICKNSPIVFAVAVYCLFMVGLCAYKNPRNFKRIFMQFYIEIFYSDLLKSESWGYNRTAIA
jgi:hypothetical protein